MSKPPSFIEEYKLSHQGYKRIAGIDEAGRGALAGPVVAAAVILPLPADFPWLSLVRDSKELSPARREYLFDLIQDEAVATGIGSASPQRIDAVGILNATKIAMHRAIERLACMSDFLLIDALTLPQLSTSQKGIIKGDKICLSIACASIIAKVSRDRMMTELHERYPGYELARHKGYGTQKHLSCLCQQGPSPIHRYSFAPVREVSISGNRYTDTVY